MTATLSTGCIYVSVSMAAPPSSSLRRDQRRPSARRCSAAKLVFFAAHEGTAIVSEPSARIAQFAGGAVVLAGWHSQFEFELINKVVALMEDWLRPNACAVWQRVPIM